VCGAAGGIPNDVLRTVTPQENLHAENDVAASDIAASNPEIGFANRKAFQQPVVKVGYT
jgi:hypothetical protein